MNEIIIKEYLNAGISFKVIEGKVFANATEMCKVFGKRISHWLENKTTEEMIEEVSSEIGIPSSQLIISKKGNSNEYSQGTWIHEKLILDLARWCNVNVIRIVPRFRL